MQTEVSIDIGISENVRKSHAEGLARVLADTYTLYLTTHTFHWNVTGPMFNPLPAMFMTPYTELWTSADLIADRIPPLGHPAPASCQPFARPPSIHDVPSLPPHAFEPIA